MLFRTVKNSIYLKYTFVLMFLLSFLYQFNASLHKVFISLATFKINKKKHFAHNFI